MIALALVGTSIGSKVVLTKLGWDYPKFMPGFFAALAALIVAVVIESKFSATFLKKAIQNLGFKFGNRVQFKVALFGIVPIILAYLFIVFFLGKPATLNDGAFFLVIKLFISQGLVEEAVFRGLIFRHLRLRNSFWTATTLSGILFGLIHLANLINGTSTEILIAVATSILFGFILTFPLAALFELGKGSIFAGALLHLAIDSINCFKEVGTSGTPMNSYLFSLLISSVVVVFFAFRSKKMSSNKIYD